MHVTFFKLFAGNFHSNYYLRTNSTYFGHYCHFLDFALVNMSGNISNLSGLAYSDDPFENAEQVDTQPETSYLANVEDISDDDFET